MSTTISTTTHSSTNPDNFFIPSYIDRNGKISNSYDNLLDFMFRMLDSSKSYMRSNRYWNSAEVCRKILLGDDKTWNSLTDSFKVEIGKLHRQGIELVSNAADIKPNFSFRSPGNDERASDEKKAEIYEQLKDFWWQDRDADAIFKDGVMEAGAGIGWIFMYPDIDPNTGQIEIIPKAKSYKEVFVYQIGMDGDEDKAYSVTVVDEIPLMEFYEKFSQAKGANIVQDRNAPSYMNKGFKKNSNSEKGIKGVLRRGLESRAESTLEPSFPMKDVFYTFTRDESINDTGSPIKMGTLINGDLGGHDSYEVPSYNGTNDKDDCRLFPYGRRLTIWTRDAILFDGAPKWLCDCAPVAKLRFRRVPKELIGEPILNSSRSLESVINNMMNSILIRMKGAGEFPIAVDESLRAKKGVIERIKSGGLKALIGKAITMNLRIAGKPIQALFDKDLFNVDQKEFEIVKSLMELMDYQQGTNDYSNLQRKNQVPGADTQEALLQLLGVVAVGQEREISRGIIKMGRIWLQFAPQVYTIERIIRILGSKGFDVKDLDKDLNSIIPNSNPNHNEIPYWKRLKQHLSKYNLFAVPGSMQQRQSMTQKLTLLQLLGKGVSISGKRLYDTFVTDGKYEESRKEWEEEQLANAKLAAKIRNEVQQITQGQGAQSPEGGNLLQQLASALQHQNTLGQGQPSTNATAPRQEIVSNPDGTNRAVSATYQK